MIKIDWTKVNWEKIFGVIESCKTFTESQERFLTAQILEYEIERQSGGQLRYVGNVEKGFDFVGIDGLKYECKSQNKIIQPTVDNTMMIKFKNSNGSTPKEVKKTADKIMLVDKGLKSVFLRA